MFVTFANIKNFIMTINNSTMADDFYGIVRRSQLLTTSTKYETAMCAILTRLGIEYVRQYKIRTPKRLYYADIYVPKHRLVIEMDGAYHYTDEQRRLDSNRSANMRKQGYRICRFANGDLRNVKKIMDKLKRFM